MKNDKDKLEPVKTQDERFVQVREAVKKYLNFAKYLVNNSTYYKMMGRYNAKDNPSLNKMDIEKLKAVTAKAKEESRKEMQDFIDNHERVFTEFEEELNRLDV